jgi:hypothetical protein
MSSVKKNNFENLKEISEICGKILLRKTQVN